MEWVFLLQKKDKSMKHFLNYEDYIITEAFKPMGIKGFSKLLYQKKKSILAIMETKDYKKLIFYLNKLFRNKIPQTDHSLIQINDYIKDIITEIELIESKIIKYPKLKKYLKNEIKDERKFIKYLKSKNRKYIVLKFFTYDYYYRLSKKNLLGRMFHWLEKFFSSNLFHMEYTKKGYEEEVKAHDLGVSSGYFNIQDNTIGFILKENVVDKVNAENYDKFVNLLESVLRHEVTHMRDFLNKGVKELRDNSGYVTYLEEVTEIKAFAESIIFNLKSNGFTKKEIEAILIEPKKNLIRVKSSDSLYVYYSTYYNKDSGKMIYYRLVSECLDILNKQYENEKIK